MCRKVLYHARDMINMQNPGCCIFGNTDSVHLVLSRLTAEFIWELTKVYGVENVCVQISKYLEKISADVTGYNTIKWEFENLYARMFYPRDLKNKYLACSIADDFGKPFLHKTNPDDFAHFTNPDNVFVSMNTYLANKNDFSKYCENYEFVRNQ